MDSKIWYKKLNGWEVASVYMALIFSMYALHGRNEMGFDLAFGCFCIGLGIMFEILVTKAENGK